MYKVEEEITGVEEVKILEDKRSWKWKTIQRGRDGESNKRDKGGISGSEVGRYEWKTTSK